MRILLLTQVAPYPPDAGPKVKTYYLIRKLVEHHDVELVTFVRDGHEREAAEQLRDLCAQVTVVDLQRQKVREPLYLARGWATGLPFLVSRDYRSEMARVVDSRISNGAIDVVHADQLSMAQYLPRPESRPPHLRTVFDAHNAVWKLVRSLAPSQPTHAHRAAAAIEWRLLKRFEGRVCTESDLTLAVSNIDARDLRMAVGGSFNVAIAPIGIEAEETEPVTVTPAHHRMLSVATMHYPPNVDAMRWFRDTVWPLLSDDDRSAGLDIVGKRPPDDLLAWARSDSSVRVHGYVADLRAVFERAGVFIVPLHAGSGLRVKILDAMARGLPIVSTSVGVEALPVASGVHLMVADDPGQFAASISELLGNPERRRELGTAAREFALQYDWRACLQPVVDAYSELAPARASWQPRTQRAPTPAG